jgi:hypothetical protein
MFGCRPIAVLLVAVAVVQESEAQQAGAGAARASLVSLVREVKEADYRGDLARLLALREQLEPFVADRELGRAAAYWRAFATWRRAINGANEDATRETAIQDFARCVEDFRGAVAIDTTWVESRIGLASCLSSSGSFANDPAQRNRLYVESSRLAAEVAAVDPLNPRLTFLQAGRLFWSPPIAGGSPSIAIALAEHRLETAGRYSTTDELEPDWGEPELHMLIAFFKLGSATRDPAGARRHAEVALQMRPQWHYVKNILIPQIPRAL